MSKKKPKGIYKTKREKKKPEKFLGNYILPENIKVFLMVLPAYLLFVSYIYLFSYYSYFGINIFSYLDIQSIVLLPIESIGVVLFSAILTVLLYVASGYGIDGLSKKIDDFQKHNKKSIQIFLAILLLGLFIFPMTLVFFFLIPWIIINAIVYDIIRNFSFAEPAFLFYFLGISLTLSPALEHSKYKDKSVKNTSWGVIIFITFFFAIPLFASSFALLEGKKVSLGQEYKYTFSSNFKGSTADVKYKFIGKSNEYYFFTPLNGDKIRVIKYDDFHKFELYEFISKEDKFDIINYMPFTQSNE